MARTTENQEFKTTQTDHGVGLTCPQDHCDGKFVVNLLLLQEDKKRSVICPYCECASLIPRP